MKPIFLQTTPHTGTNTCFYLFHHLGGIPMFFHHFGEWELCDFLPKVHGFREEFVWLHTVRPYDDVVASYIRRGLADDDTHNGAREAVKRNFALAETYAAEFSEAITLPIVGDPELQEFVARRVFQACGAEVPDTAKRFLETWPPVGTFPTGPATDPCGWDTVEQRQQMMKYMEGARVLPKNRGEDTLNEFIKGLSK